MPTLSEQATRFATRPTRDWWEDRIASEFRYTLLRVRSGADPSVEWPRLQRRLLALCNTHERNEAA